MSAKNIVVSGASYGIGRAIAVRFGSEGYHVGLLARNRDGLEQTASDITKLGGTSTTIDVDIRDFDLVNRNIEKFVKANGLIDVLWSGAFGYVEGAAVDTEIEETANLFEAGVLGAINLTKIVLRNSSISPLVYQVSADWGFPENPGLASFIAAKKAIEGFAVALQKDNLGHCRVVIVSPADVSSHSHQYDADPERVVSESDGALIATSELADLCFSLSSYKSLFVHKLNVLPLKQVYKVTYC